MKKILTIVTILAISNLAFAKELTLSCNTTTSLEGEANVSSEQKQVTAIANEEMLQMHLSMDTDIGLTAHARAGIDASGNTTYISVNIVDNVNESSIYANDGLNYKFARRLNSKSETINQMSFDCTVN